MRAIRPWLTVVCVPGLFLGLAACAPAPPPDGARLVPPAFARTLPCSTAVQSSRDSTLGPGGGELRAGHASLRVPPGALPRAVRFRLTQPAAPYLLVDAAPDGQRFGGSRAVLTLSYAHCGGSLPPRDSVAVFRWDPRTQAWDSLRSQPGPGEREVSAELEHLSVYTIGTPSRDGGSQPPGDAGHP